jgi:hypothetical protein
VNAQLIAALLLNFGATAGAMLQRNPRYNWSQLSHQLGWLLFLVGAPSGLLAIYLFIQSLGWGYGLLLWFGSGVLSVFLLGFFFDGLRTNIGTVAAIAGIVLYFFSIA